MSPYTNEQIKQQYEKLPLALKDAMYSADIAEKMVALGRKHGITIEQVGYMAEETGYVVLGLTRPTQFVTALREKLGIDDTLARKIASDINHEVFYPLRETLKSTHQVEVSEDAIQKGSGDVLRDPKQQIKEELRRLARLSKDQVLQEFQNAAGPIQKASLFFYLAKNGWMDSLEEMQIEQCLTALRTFELDGEVLARAPHLASPRVVPHYMEGKGYTDKEKAVYQVMRALTADQKAALVPEALAFPEVLRALWLTAKPEDLSMIGRTNQAAMSAMNEYADNLDTTEATRLQSDIDPERRKELDTYFQTNIAQGLGFTIGWHTPKNWKIIAK